jgi:hypothetical protein
MSNAPAAIAPVNYEPVVYNVIFNEFQRALILRVLEACPVNLLADLAKLPGDASAGYSDTAATDLLYMVKMLAELPTLEAKEPGLVHGLCY